MNRRWIRCVGLLTVGTLVVSGLAVRADVHKVSRAGVSLVLPGSFASRPPENEGMAFKATTPGGAKVVVAHAGNTPSPAVLREKVEAELSKAYDRVMAISSRSVDVGEWPAVRVTYLLRKAGETQNAGVLCLTPPQGDVIVLVTTSGSERDLVDGVLDGVRAMPGAVQAAGPSASRAETRPAPLPAKETLAAISGSGCLMAIPAGWDVNHTGKDKGQVMTVESPGSRFVINVYVVPSDEEPEDARAKLILGAIKNEYKKAFNGRERLMEDERRDNRGAYGRFRRYECEYRDMVCDVILYYTTVGLHPVVSAILLPRSISSDDYKVVLASLMSVRPDPRREGRTHVPARTEPATQAEVKPAAAASGAVEIPGTPFRITPPPGWEVSDATGNANIALSISSERERVFIAAVPFPGDSKHVREAKGNMDLVLESFVDGIADGLRKEVPAKFERKEDSKHSGGLDKKAIYLKGIEDGEPSQCVIVLSKVPTCGLALLISLPVGKEQEVAEVLGTCVDSLTPAEGAGESAGASSRPSRPGSATAAAPEGPEMYVAARISGSPFVCRRPSSWEKIDEPDLDGFKDEDRGIFVTFTVVPADGEFVRGSGVDLATLMDAFVDGWRKARAKSNTPLMVVDVRRRESQGLTKSVTRLKAAGADPDETVSYQFMTCMTPECGLATMVMYPAVAAAALDPQLDRFFDSVAAAQDAAADSPERRPSGLASEAARTPARSSSPGVGDGEFKTYRSQTLGLSFDYPAGWQPRPHEGGIELASPEEGRDKGSAVLIMSEPESSPAKVIKTNLLQAEANGMVITRNYETMLGGKTVRIVESHGTQDTSHGQTDRSVQIFIPADEGVDIVWLVMIDVSPRRQEFIANKLLASFTFAR